MTGYLKHIKKKNKTIFIEQREYYIILYIKKKSTTLSLLIIEFNSDE